jgi:predicted  nucleic acid-binding Zn-ribbon protein
LTVHSDVESLLALQTEDQAIGEMEARLAALEPRLREMDVAHAAAVEALDRARRAVEAEEGAHRELQTRIAQHKLLHERNIAQLDSVRRMKEATAAMSQVEQARRILAEEEGALQGISRRLTELRGTVETHERALAELESQHHAERHTIGEARAEVDGQLASRRTTRAGSAAKVDRVLLQKYDRIRTVRHDGAIFPLRGPSCGHCDTSVPMQRRNVMAAKGTIEVCETCGVLMYAAT